MKSKVILSRYSLILTVILLIVMAIGCFFTFENRTAFCTWISVFAILTVFTLLYGVSSITVTPEYVIMQSPLKRRKIPVRNIESVRREQPTMGAIRILGSGGCLGYWGLFREGDIGRYYAFYGKGSDCFMIRMKNGDKYLLGCENPDAMVACIENNRNLSQSK